MARKGTSPQKRQDALTALALSRRGPGGGSVVAVTGVAPIHSSGGAAPAISITPATNVASGSMSAADKTKLDAIPSPPGAGTTVLTDTAGVVSWAAPAAGVTSVTASLPLASSGGATPNISLTTPLPADDGGTGLASLTSHAVIVGAGTAPVSEVGPGAVGLPLLGLGAGADPVFAAMPLGSLAQSGAAPGQIAEWNGAAWVPTSIAPGGVTNVTGTAPITSSGGATPAIGITAATDVAAGSMSAADKTKLDAIGAIVTTVTASSPLASSGGTAPNITLATPVGVPLGGTGQATLTAHAVLVGEGASGIAQIGPGAVGLPLLGAGAGADPAFGSLPAASITPVGWTSVAASATQAVAAQDAPQFFALDSTGAAAALFNFPAVGHDGQEVTIIAEGTTNDAGINLAPGGTNLMADPKAAGLYGGAGITVTSNEVGTVIRRKYSTTASKWRPF